MQGPSGLGDPMADRAAGRGTFRLPSRRTSFLEDRPLGQKREPKEAGYGRDDLAKKARPARAKKPRANATTPKSKRSSRGSEAGANPEALDVVKPSLVPESSAPEIPVEALPEERAPVSEAPTPVAPEAPTGGEALFDVLKEDAPPVSEPTMASTCEPPVVAQIEEPPAPLPTQSAPEAAAPSEDTPWWDRPDLLVELGDRVVVASSPSESALLMRVSARLEAGKYTLPVLPLTLIKVIEVANIPDPDAKVIADCIRTDAVVAGEVLSLVNSAAYAAATPIKDLQRAVVHVGTRKIRSLMIAVAARLTVFRSCDAARAQQLWLHSLATAVLARSIARDVAADPEEAFLAGLLHDVGKTVVLGLVTEEERANTHVRVGDALLEKLCDTVHTGTGARVAKAWKLAPPILEAIEGHHRLHKNSQSVVAVTSLANDICGYLGLGCARRAVSLGQHPAFSLLGLDDERAEGLLARIPDVLEEAPEFRGVVKIERGAAERPEGFL